MFDCFVDTKKKRFSLITSMFYAFGIYASILSLVLSYQMIQISDTTTLYEMVDLIDFHFIGRVILNGLESGVVYKSSITMMDMISIVLSSISMSSFLFIIIYACFIGKRQQIEH